MNSSKIDFGKKKKKSVQTRLVFQKLTPEKVEEAREKAKPKPTTTILNFFKKIDQDVMFISEDAKAIRTLSTKQEESVEYPDADVRFNDSDSPVKRRKLSPGPGSPRDDSVELPNLELPNLNSASAPPVSNSSPSRGQSRVGGFVMDSDSEGEDNNETKPNINILPPHRPSSLSPIQSIIPEQDPVLEELMRKSKSPAIPEVEAKKEDEVLNDDLFIGEDSMVLAEEEYEAMLAIQAENCKEAAEDSISFEELDDFHVWPQEEKLGCPICNGSLEFTSPDEATLHVNSCLDGNPTPLPTRPKAVPFPTPSSSSANHSTGPLPSATKMSTSATSDTSSAAKTTVPRPGQQLLFDISSLPLANSAFSKLMSGRAEQLAWSEATQQAQRSKGKPAHTRTCPFYKIMPGLSICVDAFRYGAIHGCKAYFLSHFHSDHYIGLSSNWSHGPIYCSKVTGTLMQKQLRVAEKWIIMLDWEVPMEVPGTEGVTVIMIPANHCPGSSMFLFEKKIGTGERTRKQRILHCGDFRACTAHVTHPLLRPETIKTLSGKTEQQSIDICYLDTTYLDPRYAFPPQQDVITASADLCSEMSSDPDSPCETWDRLLKGNKNKGKRNNKAPKKEFSTSKFFGGAADITPPKSPSKAQTTFSGPVDKKLLVICGTYSIGKERICIAIAQRLKTKIFAPTRKLAICKILEDPELAELLTSNPTEAQVHLQALGEIRPDVIDEYRRSFGPRFSRVVAFKPSGWSYKPPACASDGTSAPPANAQPNHVPTSKLMHGAYWKARFSKEDITAARGGTKTALCLGVPYSEHSSFRELALFLISLNIEKVIPTVNVGSDASRQKMKVWIDRWISERKRGGAVVPLEGDEKRKDVVLWDGKTKGSGVFW